MKVPTVYFTLSYANCYAHLEPCGFVIRNNYCQRRVGLGMRLLCKQNKTLGFLGYIYRGLYYPVVLGIIINHRIPIKQPGFNGK